MRLLLAAMLCACAGGDDCPSGHCEAPESDEFSALSRPPVLKAARLVASSGDPVKLPRCVCEEYRNGASIETVPICMKVEGGVKKCLPPNPGDGKCPGDHETCTPTEVPPPELPPCTCEEYRNGATASTDPLCLKNEGGVQKCLPPNPGDGKCPGDHEMCTTQRTEPTFVGKHGRPVVKGNKLLDAHGEVLRLRGTSFFWSQWEVGSKYYNADVVNWLVKDWNVTIVRAALGVEPDGYLLHPERERARVEKVVDAAIRAGIYVIIDWHDHHAEEHLSESKAFFEDMARKYGSFPHVMFEPFNEPESQPWATVIKPYHEAVLPVIRKYSDNVAILGTRQWSQLVNEAAQDPVSFENVAYTLHFYAGTHTEWLRGEAVAAMGNGAAVFCSEWGTSQADGNGGVFLEASQEWMDFFEEQSISDLNWATDDKDETSAQLLPGASEAGGWGKENLTISGAWVRASLRGDPPPPTPASTPMPPTPAPCTVCAKVTESCQESKCCADKNLTCYVKDQHWASCKPSCTPGIDPEDPPEFQTNWTCEVLTCGAPVACSESWEDCRESKCCKDAGLKCYEKDQYWASCKESCTPGIDPNDDPAFATNWTCVELR